MASVELATSLLQTRILFESGIIAKYQRFLDLITQMNLEMSTDEDCFLRWDSQQTVDQIRACREAPLLVLTCPHPEKSACYFALGAFAVNSSGLIAIDKIIPASVVDMAYQCKNKGELYTPLDLLHPGQEDLSSYLLDGDQLRVIERLAEQNPLTPPSQYWLPVSERDPSVEYY